ncbi:hypothetical protein H7I94_08630 [Mycobacterium szulgai]|nr:hypothetical protein [Mycobacterium szulgai]
MGMTQLLARCAARRAHVLTVEAPGYWVVRAETELRFRARRWCAATSPADADVLAVCGVPGPELSEATGRVWDQLPGPRVRIDVPDLQTVDSALERAAAELVDIDMHRNDARERIQSPNLSGDHDHADHGRPHQQDHAQHAHGGYGEHQHMDHGAMDMAPVGIALAEGGEDRDGLEMDELHVRVGPVLRYWPAGLVVRWALHGDVLAGTQAWMLDSNLGNCRPPSDLRDGAARHCDHVVDVLELAGWPCAATIARTARDTLLREPNSARGRSVLDTLHRKLRRSRVLRWSLRDIASLTVKDCDGLGLPAALAGDCYDRLLARVDIVRRALSEPLEPNVLRVAAAGIVDTLPHLVDGLDLATARLLIASLGIDTAPVEAGGRDG